MAYTGKKPVDFVDVTQSQSMTVSDDLTVNNDTTVAGDLTVDTNTLYVDSTNNRVGIGTSSPEASLHIEGSGVSSLRFGNIGPLSNSSIRLSRDDTTVIPGNPLGFLEFGGNDSTSNIDAAFAYVSGEASGTHEAGSNQTDLTFGTTSSGSSTPQERVRIDSDGRLLQGDNFSLISSTVGIQSRKTSGDNYLYMSSNSLGANEQALISTIGYYNGNAYYTTIASYRNSTNPPASYLNLTNRNRTSYFHWVDTSGILRLSTSATNIGSTSGTVVGTQTSDERLKTIEANFEYGIDTVKQLLPIAYKFNNDDTEQRRLGFGAQTTQGIVPEAVYDSEECIDGYDDDPEDDMVKIPRSDDTKMMMDSVQLIPVLTKALQEAIAKIETLEEKVAALENA